MYYVWQFIFQKLSLTSTSRLGILAYKSEDLNLFFFFSVSITNLDKRSWTLLSLEPAAAPQEDWTHYATPPAASYAPSMLQRCVWSKRMCFGTNCKSRWGWAVCQEPRLWPGEEGKYIKINISNNLHNPNILLMTMTMETDQEYLISHIARIIIHTGSSISYL